jgi:parallel beta-helix repeat protein
MEAKENRTKVIVGLLALVCLLLVWTLATAGDLEPSGPPGLTMKTLDEVEPRIPIHASDLPLVITEPNSYYLAEDVNFTNTTSNAITIECNDVTIDLMGYSLTGPNSTNYDGIYMNGRTNVEVRNGTVRDFYNGIYEQSGRAHRIINTRVVSNNNYGIYVSGYGYLVKDCTATENGNHGIYSGSGSTVTGNTCYNNSGGIYTGNGSTVTGNTCYNNSGNGIDVLYGSTVTSNTIYNNGAGIEGSQYCIITGNTACNNSHDGIIVTNANSAVTGNSCYGNGWSGIQTNFCNTITGNSCLSNGHNGISANGSSTIIGNTVQYSGYSGIGAGSNSTVSDNVVNQNNTSDNANYAGIWVWGDCRVKSNTVTLNKQNNIYTYDSDNAIEENLVTDGTGNGIYFRIGGNFYANNRASGNGTNYNNGAAQTDGGGNYSF